MPSLMLESWTWYGIAALVYAARVVSRITTRGRVQLLRTTKINYRRGLKNLQLSDLLMALAFFFYTSEIVTMNITAKLQSNLFPPGYLQTHTLSPEEIQDRRHGSVMTVVVEQCQISTIWLIKFCVLLMWSDLTNIAYSHRSKFLYAIGAYIVLSWLFMEVFYFFVWCRPFTNYFAVPTPDPHQCAAAWNHLITNAVFNISSDLLLLGITVSIAFEVSFRAFTSSRKRSVGFIALCSLGIFVIICSVLNKAYSFGDPYGSGWTFWYIRECSTAMIVSNLPYAWQLFHGFFMRFGGGQQHELSNTTISAVDVSRRRPSEARTKKSANSANSNLDLQDLESLEKIPSPLPVYKKTVHVDEYSLPSSSLTSPTSSIGRPGLESRNTSDAVFSPTDYRITSAEEARALCDEEGWYLSPVHRRRMKSVGPELVKIMDSVESRVKETKVENETADEDKTTVTTQAEPIEMAEEKVISPLEPIFRPDYKISSSPPRSATNPWDDGPEIEDVGGLSHR